MTTERWDDEKLDRLASIVENNARLVESNARSILALANAAAEAREERDRLFQRMEQQQAEIVGLRRETNRLLDMLLNQRNQDDNPNN
ncbi:hypothetical protein ACE1B6_27495 [Aerosakkonemataceae cyanobacterium BLCC-F154]|uniref:Uncharacterized protein n=1 Tax=Floridaenema fluviatile BLCC-F154 TaxID=3153640 RepID=A0ABV4YME1_9CYAN